MLGHSLFIGREVARVAVLVQFEHPHGFALHQHRDKQKRPGALRAGVASNRERAAVDVRNRQQRPVGEARHYAGLSSPTGRRERNGNRRAALVKRPVQRLGGAVVDEQLDPRDAQDARQNLGNPLQHDARRWGAQNLFAKLIRLP